jgi:GNAT superfamily N-acetyltransferase
MVTIEQCQNIEELRPLAELWLKEHSADNYGLEVDIDVIAQDLMIWLCGEGTVLVAKENDEVIGMFALFVAPSYLGKQKIAVEKYWYTQRGRAVAGPKLYIEAVEWARLHGCSHLITSGSKMASDRHDAICRFLERTGARHFETSYIYELGN